MSAPIIPSLVFKKFQSLSFSTSGNNDVIAGVAGQKVKVLSVLLMANADVNMTFKDTAGNTYSGAMPMGVKGNGFVLPFCEDSWLETATGSGFRIVLDGAVQMSGLMTYLQEP